MSKAERRKRARQRAKERETVTEAGLVTRVTEVTEQPPTVTLTASAGNAQAADTSADYITGPIAPVERAVVLRPRTGAPALRAGTRLELPALIDEPIEPEDDEHDEDEGSESSNGTDDEDDDERDEDTADGDDADEDGDELSEDDEEQEEAVDEALFNGACVAVEQGSRLGWPELVQCLCLAPVEDPRLGLLVALLIEGDTRLTGERVLTVLNDLELDDIVTEARETSELLSVDAADTPEERAVIRTNARDLNEQARASLDSPPVQASSKPGSKQRPLRASDVRAQKTALSAPGAGGVMPRRPA